MQIRLYEEALLIRMEMCLHRQSLGDDGSETREYPYGEVFAHVIGYSNSKLGTTGLESVENFELLTSNAFFLEKLQNEFSEKKNRGDTVVTTLDANLQQAAYDALGSNKGAAIVMERVRERFSPWFPNRYMIRIIF